MIIDAELKARMDAQYAQHREYSQRQRNNLPSILRAYYDNPLDAMSRAGFATMSAPGLMRLAADEIDRLRKAPEQIAARDDTAANEHLKATGSYARFDEPGAVQIARETLDGKP